MAKNETTIDIQAAPEQIFPYLVGEEATQWAMGLENVTQTSDGERGVGTAFDYHYKNRGVDEIIVHLTIEEYVANQRLQLNSKAGDGSAGYELFAAPNGQHHPINSYRRNRLSGLLAQADVGCHHPVCPTCPQERYAEAQANR